MPVGHRREHVEPEQPTACGCRATEDRLAAIAASAGVERTRPCPSAAAVRESILDPQRSPAPRFRCCTGGRLAAEGAAGDRLEHFPALDALVPGSALVAGSTRSSHRPRRLREARLRLYEVAIRRSGYVDEVCVIGDSPADEIATRPSHSSECFPRFGTAARASSNRKPRRRACASDRRRAS